MPRMTVRRWMIAVVVVALPLEGRSLLLRRAEYLSKAREFEVWAWRFDDFHYRKNENGHYVFNAELNPDGSMTPASVAYLDRERNYNAAMARKYFYAAWHPWLTVEADPPLGQAPLGQSSD